jgi:hypothetical protein
MAECVDFKNEETALQYLGTQLGVTVELTPKFHAKLAGKGVEYSWVLLSYCSTVCQYVEREDISTVTWALTSK